jgi:hypothetical protein
VICQFYFAALYLVFAFQKGKAWCSAEAKPELEGRSEATKRASEDVSDSSVSKHLKSTDLTVGGGENL